MFCENCGKRLERTLHAISPHNYCSLSCAAIFNNRKRPERNAEKIKCPTCGKVFKKWVVGNKKYCSMECCAEAKCYKPEDLLEIIRNAVRDLKRVPARRELKSINDSCKKLFGSWNKAVAAAGLQPNRSHGDRMYKRIMTKASDGHFCDSMSEAVVDNWLAENDIPHEKDVHYPNTHHKADWGIILKNQKIFVEYFGLANDSPRYDRTVKEKRQLCRENEIPLIEIYPKDIFPRNSLNQNLKNKFEEFFEA